MASRRLSTAKRRGLSGNRNARALVSTAGSIEELHLGFFHFPGMLGDDERALLEDLASLSGRIQV